jgi:outer membrane protein OmpA-like peptidoglycan-associated protein
VLVIDPLIDAATGAQTAGTVQMGEQLAAMVPARQPQWNVKPLTRATLADSPLLLIGTLTAVQTRGDLAEPADAFRIWLTLVDLKTGRVVAKSLDRATAGSVDATPTRYFRDSPTWHKDRTVTAYIRSCQVDTKIGDPIEPGYMIRLPAAALLNEAIIAYGENKLAEAARLYRDASLVSDPDDLRVHNGLYLTHWRLGRKQEAAQAFSRIVASGLDNRQLPLKLLFTPGTTNFAPLGDISSQYALWLREISRQTAQRKVCLKVIGHTSRTGSAALNDALSERRAGVIAQSLEQQTRGLGSRLQAAGMGFRETLIGLGTDDLRDALDRRVGFRVVECAAGS